MICFELDPEIYFSMYKDKINILLYITSGLFMYKYSSFLFNKKINTSIPLQCSYKNIFNYNTVIEDSYDEDLEVPDDDEDLEVPDDNEDLEVTDDNEDLEVTDDSSNNSDCSDSSEENKSKNKCVYLTSNYYEAMDGCNNPFYKDLKIQYSLSIQKINNMTGSFLSNSDIIINEDNNEDNNDIVNIYLKNNGINHLRQPNNEKLLFKFLESVELKNIVGYDNNNKTITLPSNWKISTEDEEYITFNINENNVYNLFSNIKKILNCYYTNGQKYSTINFIYNENSSSPVLLNQSNISFKNDDYITYNLLNIKDLYAYKNHEKKLLDYYNVDFKLDLDKFKKYYIEGINDLTNDDLNCIYKKIY